jgi:site-specific DNA-methyltransferase (adenine-specific)
VQKNQLYYGDNLTVLREHIKDESVDLIYLDPPFNSRQDYNVLFAERDGTRSASQIMAFEDTWEWNMDAEAAYEEIVERGGRVSDAMRAFRTFLGHSDMMAYLAMMAPRLIELHRVLKETGSIYLHCDPTASHYLKILMDAVFGVQQFRNEIVWKRTRAHNDAKLTRFGAVHDIILFYSRSIAWRFNRTLTTRDENAPKTHDLHRHTDGMLYRKGDCRAPGGRGPRYEWNGHVQNWRFTEDEAKRLESEGRIVFSKTGMPRVLRPVDLTKGSALQDVWTDIDPPNSGSGEILGYPTQKPLALLKRILEASSSEYDTVLDPFCGCGTAIDAAQRLNRRWIGIDITHLAIGLIKKRLDDAFGESVRETYEVIGEPVDLKGAEALAKEDPYQFQWWALSLVGARPLEKKKGADQGIDGRLYFHDEKGGKTKQIILSVKAGKLHATYVRDLRGVIEREKAEIGVLIAMESPTKPMQKEAADAGFYHPPGLADKYPRLQILNIEELLAAKRIDYPRFASDATFKKAPRAKKAAEEQIPLGKEEIGEPF